MARKEFISNYTNIMVKSEHGYVFTKKDFDRNEDQNFHTKNGVELVKMFGTPEESIKMGGIAARHNMKGSITRKDQKARDAIVSKYYPKLKD
jgi:hypothetical protein|tara:strand:+ start:554 stop:829 length:276 start_codon:yes stop_codon:yes gene_type:complete